MPIFQVEWIIAIVYYKAFQNINQEITASQKMSARLTCNETKYCCITPLLVDFHWLTIEFRIEFKSLLIVFNIFKV